MYMSWYQFPFVLELSLDYVLIHVGGQDVVLINGGVVQHPFLRTSANENNRAGIRADWWPNPFCVLFSLLIYSIFL